METENNIMAELLTVRTLNDIDMSTKEGTLFLACMSMLSVEPNYSSKEPDEILSEVVEHAIKIETHIG